MINSSPISQPELMFRLSPRLTWQKVLGQKPYITHYKISEAPGTTPELAGSATLQIFPPVDYEGQRQVPVILHYHAYPLARGGQFAGFTSQVLWFDAQQSSLVATCRYSDNQSLQAMFEDMGPWDWITNPGTRLSLPTQPITINFNNTDVNYSSAWNPVSRKQALIGTGIGQGNAYGVGTEYQFSDETLERRVQLRTGRGIGLVGYAWSTMWTREQTELTEQVFWVNTGQNTIDQIDTEVTVVEVLDDGTHHWVQRPSIWTRIS
mgnify:CR=1 FL=1